MNPSDRGFEYVISTLIQGRNKSMSSSSTIEEPSTPPGGKERDESPASRETMLFACLIKAEELLGVLAAESEALRHFDSDLLLGLVHQKEYSLNVLHDSLRALRSLHGLNEMVATPASISRLRETLGKIKRMNDSNRIFIEGSLNHYHDLLRTILPTVYGQSEGSPTYPIVNCTGVAIRRKA
jgi:hypothetical protein